MNIYKLIIIVLFTIFYSLTSLAEIVSKIEINGNKRISDETIKVYGSVNNLGSDLSKSDLDKILKNLYSTNFFETVNVELSNGILKINLKEYPIVNQLIIIGEKSNKIENEIKKFINLKEKNSFIENFLREDIKTIKSLYSSIGYNFAKIETKVKKIDDDKLDLVFIIDRGEITKISKITFTGDKKIKEKRLRDIIASEEDKFWKVISNNTKFSENLINLDVRLLKNYYKSIGYYDVEVSSSSAEVDTKGNVNINYTINAGDRYIIEKISTTVDPVFDKKIFFPLEKSYKKIIGDYYSPFRVKKILDEIDELIADNNLQFVEHKVKEQIGDGKINLIFDIQEGKKILVERINVLGNSVTNENVVRSELLLDEGDPFTNINLEKSISNIKARRIFNSVSSTVKDGSSKDLKVIDIKVEEKPTGEISAGAGVGTNGGLFAFNIKENNWLGEGKQVGVDVEISEESIKGELNYVDPNYDLLGNSLRYNLANITNDKPDQGYENKLFSLGVGTSFEQYRDITASIGLDATYDDLRTTNNASSALKKQSGEFSEISARYGFAYDKRNRTFMPTDGFISSFQQSLPLYADKPFLDNTLTFSSYHSFSDDIVGAAKLYMSSINGLDDEDVRISKRRFLSTKRLRGFQKSKIGPVDGSDHVGGNYATALNLEANLPNLLPDSSNLDVGLFLDFGNVWGVDYDDSIDESNKVRSSTGVVANWNSPVGPMSFVFSSNLSKATTDKTESFNFQLGTTF